MSDLCPRCAPNGHPELARKVLFHSECVTRRAPIVHQLAALAIVQSGVKRIDDRAVSVLYSNLLMMGPIDLPEPVSSGFQLRLKRQVGTTEQPMNWVPNALPR